MPVLMRLSVRRAVDAALAVDEKANMTAWSVAARPVLWPGLFPMTSGGVLLVSLLFRMRRWKRLETLPATTLP
jgi:hypothetical protein